MLLMRLVALTAMARRRPEPTWHAEEIGGVNSSCVWPAAEGSQRLIPPV